MVNDMDRLMAALFALGIVAILIFLSEAVACEWHADNLTNGCQSSPFRCEAQKEKPHGP